MSENTQIEEAQPQNEEVKNPVAILSKNRELREELVQARAELETTKTALLASQAETVELRAQWHESAVMGPFEAMLATATPLPTKYLREGLIERGIVKMVAGEDGIERPTWHDKDGVETATPADPWRYLCDLKDDGLNAMLRSRGMSGSGAPAGSFSSGSTRPATPETKPAPKPPAYGLR